MPPVPQNSNGPENSQNVEKENQSISGWGSGQQDQTQKEQQVEVKKEEAPATPG